MASKKDMRRDDLVVPYMDPAKDKNEGDMSGTVVLTPYLASCIPDVAQGTIASTLPMAAMFTRNKMIGWASVMFALQTWLAETPEQKRTAATPGYFSVGMALMAVIVTYLPLFFPPPAARAGTGTEPPAAVPPS